MSRLKVRLRKPAEFALKTGHPWVFADSITEQNRPLVTGEIGVIYDSADRLLALALCERDSPIAMRVVHRVTRGAPQQVNEEFWAAKLAQAIEKRSGIDQERTNGYRIIHGENDGFPGLVVDRYASVAVLKVYTSAWFPHLPMLKSLLQGLTGAQHLMLRLSRHAQAKANTGNLGISEGWWHGEAPLPVIFSENGLLFEADVLKGQKTGFFLDQRENRDRVGGMARGKHVLNAFSYTGGFSLYAAKGGARSVTDLDVSPHALESSARNFRLNPSIHHTERKTILADAFAWMESGPRQTYDLIITDPPSLAKKAAEKEAALRRYELLNLHAINRLTPGGTLVAASCSAHVTAEEFYSAALRAGKKSGRVFQELWRSGPPADHPATFPEANYLKAVALQLR
jgi:23S rRNA (cytosine1962-C5)-methyltransferase